MDGNHIDIERNLCKGCKLCVEFCPHHCIAIGSDINILGYQFAKFVKPECTACGFCFYMCPEPGTIKVFKE